MAPWRVHPTTNLELDKLLWRYQQGWHDANRISKALNEQVDKLSAHSFKLSDNKELLRRFRQKELIHIDNLRGEIVLHIGRAEFVTAIEKIRQSYEILSELEDTVIAIEHYDSVQKAIGDLVILTSKGLFAGTPTLKIISQLQKKTKEYLEIKETRKAGLNLLVCRAEMAYLIDIQDDIAKSKQLESKVEELERTLERIQNVKFLGEKDRTCFSKITRIKELIRSKHLALAERLLEEFEIVISDKLLLFSEYQKAPGNMKKSILKKRKDINKLEDIFRHLLEKRLITIKSYIEIVNQEVSKFFETKEKEK